MCSIWQAGVGGRGPQHASIIFSPRSKDQNNRDKYLGGSHPHSAVTFLSLPNMLFAAGFALLFSSLAAAQDYGGPAPPTTTAPSAPPIPSAPANTTGHVNVRHFSLRFSSSLPTRYPRSMSLRTVTLSSAPTTSTHLPAPSSRSSSPTRTSKFTFSGPWLDSSFASGLTHSVNNISLPRV